MYIWSSSTNATLCTGVMLEPSVSSLISFLYWGSPQHKICVNGTVVIHSTKLHNVAKNGVSGNYGSRNCISGEPPVLFIFWDYNSMLAQMCILCIAINDSSLLRTYLQWYWLQSSLPSLYVHYWWPSFLYSTFDYIFCLAHGSLGKKLYLHSIKV